MEEISQISNIVNIPQLYNRKFYYNRKYKISCNLSRNTMNVSLKKFKCFQQKLKMTKYSVVFPKKTTSTDKNDFDEPIDYWPS